MKTANRAMVMERVRSRWQHYVMLSRWKRADRLKRLLERLEAGSRPMPRRLSA